MTVDSAKLYSLAGEAETLVNGVKAGQATALAVPAFYTATLKTKQFAAMATSYVSQASGSSSHDTRHCQHWENVASAVHDIAESLIQMAEHASASDRKALNRQAAQALDIADDALSAVREIAARHIQHNNVSMDRR